MNFKKILFNKKEKPLDSFVESYSNTSIFEKIAFIGDSLSSGEFEAFNNNGDRTYHDMFWYSWGQYIARKNGITAYNFSRGGMTAKEYVESFAEANGMWDKEKAAQAYVIALGVNDLYVKRGEVGSVSDIDREDYRNNKPTFIGYYAAIVSRYKEINPDSKFFFVTFPNTVDNAKDTKTAEMIKALYDLTAIFDNSYVIDLFKYGPVYDEEFKKKYYLHSHLNPMGYILTAKLVDSYIDYIIRHNPDDFKNVGFIGKGIEYKGEEK